MEAWLVGARLCPSCPPRLHVNNPPAVHLDTAYFVQQTRLSKQDDWPR